MLTVSLVTATFNAANTIVQSIESARCQDYSRIEHIVVDGKSSDETLALLAPFSDYLASVVSEPDSGIYDALNKGVLRATGDVIGVLHADDLLVDPQVLSYVARVFEQTSADAVYGDLLYVNRNDPNRVIRHWRAGQFSREKLAKGWMPPHPALFIRRSLYEGLGLYDTRYRIAADYELILRFLLRPQTITVYLPRVLVKMRVGGVSNATIRNLIRKSWEDYAVMRRAGLSATKALVYKNLSKIPQFLSKP